jgi:hypothetical protein
VPRQARERHRERIVAERQFDTLKLIGEEVAEFEYRPVACHRDSEGGYAATAFRSMRSASRRSG